MSMKKTIPPLKHPETDTDRGYSLTMAALSQARFIDRSHGATTDTREELHQLVLVFFASRLRTISMTACGDTTTLTKNTIFDIKMNGNFWQIFSHALKTHPTPVGISAGSAHFGVRAESDTFSDISD
jgi:hypothetical protein